MIRFFILFLPIVFALQSCNQQESSTIDMSDEDLVAIMQDVHIAKSIVIKYRSHDRDSISQILRSQIAEIHNVSIERVDYVMEQIQLSPQKYLDLEKKAVLNLKAMKDSLKLGPIIKEEKQKNIDVNKN